jgi:hypothetical protein
MLGLVISFSVLALLDCLPPVDLRRSMPMLLAAARVVTPPVWGDAQTLAVSATSATVRTGMIASQSYLTYTRPTQTTELHNYFFDTFGPHPIAVAALGGGIDQFDNSPREWNRGVEGYGKRFGSNLGVEAVSTTTRYALSEALKQDPLYYRCECKSVFPRLGHAVGSTFTARTGEDGHRVFSFPALVGPYAASVVAVYAWCPNRYGAKDAFRFGNYSLLEYMGGNIAFEFLYTSPRSWLSRMHLASRHGAPSMDSSQ